MLKTLLTYILPALLASAPAVSAVSTVAAPAPAASKSITQPAGYASLESLVEDAVTHLNSRDTAALAGMAFGREEFLRAYPLFESDTSRSRRDFACDFYLADNRKILERRLGQEGGRSLEVARIEVQGERRERKGFELSRGLKIWVRDGDREYELRFLKSAVRTGSGWKVWSFEDD